MLNFSFKLGLGQLQNSVDGFLLGIADESAGIDDERIEPGVAGRIKPDRDFRTFQLPVQPFAVDQVFGAPERNDPDGMLAGPGFHGSGIN